MGGISIASHLISRLNLAKFGELESEALNSL